MTPAEAAALLTVCAAFDNRKPDENAATAWSLALDGLRFVDCRDAVVAHYRKTRDWIMPSDVIAGVKSLRAARLADFKGRVTLNPPRELADDPAAEIAWFNDLYRRAMDGEHVEVPPEHELKPRDMASLGQIGRTVPRG